MSRAGYTGFKSGVLDTQKVRRQASIECVQAVVVAGRSEAADGAAEPNELATLQTTHNTVHWNEFRNYSVFPYTPELILRCNAWRR